MKFIGRSMRIRRRLSWRTSSFQPVRPILKLAGAPFSLAAYYPFLYLSRCPSGSYHETRVCLLQRAWLIVSIADSMDVNVSPDKRTILLHSEKNLIEALKVCRFSLHTENEVHLLTGGRSRTRDRPSPTLLLVD